MAGWQESDIPDQRGRVAVVTGANGGIGLHTARALAEHGATVVIAARNLDRSKAAAQLITASAPGAVIYPLALDLGSLESVRSAAAQILASHDRIDLLVNNAGVNVSTPATTGDGLETQMGVNHLGHFALTGLLLERLRATPGSRVVNVNSLIHRQGELTPAEAADPATVTSSGKDNPDYARSKLAGLLFTHELARRLSEAGADTIAVAAHPGGAAGTAMAGNRIGPVMDFIVGRVLGRTAERGALPTLRAATDVSVRTGEYYGPGGLFEVFGAPGRVSASAKAHDLELQRLLWEGSERVTGVTFGLPAGSSAPGSPRP